MNASNKFKSINKYILLTNANIKEITKECLVEYPFDSFDNNLQNQILKLNGIRENPKIIKKIFFVKGPGIGEIEGLISYELLLALSDKKENHDILRIIKMLLNYIDSMCEGPIDLSDKIYGNEIEYETNYMNHKTLTIEKLEKIISDNFRYPSLSDEENIEVSIVLPKPNSEISDELTKLISEYSKFKDMI